MYQMQLLDDTPIAELTTVRSARAQTTMAIDEDFDLTNSLSLSKLKANRRRKIALKKEVTSIQRSSRLARLKQRLRQQYKRTTQIEKSTQPQLELFGLLKGKDGHILDSLQFANVRPRYFPSWPSSQTDFGSIPAEFPLDGRFVPSGSLIDIWTRSLNSAIADILHYSSPEQMGKQKFYSSEQDRDVLLEAFSIKFETSLAILADYQAINRSEDFLTFMRKFQAGFKTEIQNSMNLLGDDVPLFLNSLYLELSQWLRAGRELNFSWGSLILVDGDLKLLIKSEGRLTSGSFEKARVLD